MSFEQWYFEIPIVTRCYLTASVLTTAACYFDIISPFSLYLNYRLIFEKYEVWRILTNFFFFGMPSLDFVFHMYFLVRYCRLLEEVCECVSVFVYFCLCVSGACVRLQHAWLFLNTFNDPSSSSSFYIVSFSRLLSQTHSLLLSLPSSSSHRAPPSADEVQTFS